MKWRQLFNTFYKTFPSVIGNNIQSQQQAGYFFTFSYFFHKNVFISSRFLHFLEKNKNYYLPVKIKPSKNY